jgi:hypothetical protein
MATEERAGIERQRDIQIYIRDCPPERLIGWLESVVGPLDDPEPAGSAVVHRSSNGSVVVTPRIEDGPFVSVWFNTPGSPWATDVDCARQAARELGYVVRCCPGQHFPDVPWWASDRFLEIANGVEKTISWEYAERDTTVGRPRE